MSQSEGTDWQVIGTHAWRLEPPDVLRISFSGDVSGDDMSQLLALMHRCYQERGRLFGLVDLSRMGALSPAARKVAAVTDLDIVFQMVFVGASFSQRAMIKLVDVAYHLLTKNTENPPGVFFEAEATALAWMAQQRRTPPTAQ